MRIQAWMTATAQRAGVGAARRGPRQDNGAGALEKGSQMAPFFWPMSQSVSARTVII